MQVRASRDRRGAGRWGEQEGEAHGVGERSGAGRWAEGALSFGLKNVVEMAKRWSRGGGALSLSKASARCHL